MKTWQMIKELTENPEKKFRRKEANSYVTVEDGKIVWRGEFQNGQEMAIGFIDERDCEWEEVKEPVSFAEVLEQVSKSKTEVLITIKHPQLDTLYSKVPFGWIANRLFRDFKDDKQIAKILQTSEFYIE